VLKVQYKKFLKRISKTPLANYFNLYQMLIGSTSLAKKKTKKNKFRSTEFGFYGTIKKTRQSSKA